MLSLSFVVRQAMEQAGAKVEEVFHIICSFGEDPACIATRKLLVQSRQTRAELVHRVQCRLRLNLARARLLRDGFGHLLV